MNFRHPAASLAVALTTTLTATLATLTLTSPAWAQKVKLATSMGDILIELAPDKSPKTVANFVQYVKAGHYNGVVFHRVIDGFMIQTGGFSPDMQEKPTRAAIPLESRNGLSNLRGSIAMARTSVPDSASAQFFINVGDNLNLDAAKSQDGNGYAVFGKVVEGMDVVDKIKTVPVGNQAGHQNVPRQPVTIQQATLIQEK